MTILLVQGNAYGAKSGSTIPVTLSSTPTSGNVLIATICNNKEGPSPVTVSSISQTGVTWTLQKAHYYYWSSPYVTFDCEIWLGVVGSGASKDITINLSGTPAYGAFADVCEWSGVATSDFLDQTASNQNENSAQTDTGTTSTTTQANELWIGAVAACNTQSSPTNGFTLLDGEYVSGFICMGYLYKIVSSTGAANTGTTVGYADHWVGCIATFKAAEAGGQPYISRVQRIPGMKTYGGNL